MNIEEIKARRARLGMPTNTKAFSQWHLDIARREAEQLEREAKIKQMEREFTQQLAVWNALSRYRQTVERDGVVVRNLLPAKVSPYHRVQRAIRLIQKLYRVSEEELFSKRRTARIINARHAAIYMASRLTNWSLPEIGRRIGGVDHTTVLHALRRMGEKNPRREYAPRVTGRKPMRAAE